MNLAEIKDRIREAGYEPREGLQNNIVISAILILILGIYVMASHMGWMGMIRSQINVVS